MSTYNEEVAEATTYMGYADDQVRSSSGTMAKAMYHMAQAQVHATLALAAATLQLARNNARV